MLLANGEYTTNRLDYARTSPKASLHWNTRAPKHTEIHYSSDNILYDLFVLPIHDALEIH